MIQAWSMHSLGSDERCRFKEYQYLGLMLMVNLFGQKHITASTLHLNGPLRMWIAVGEFSKRKV